MRKYLYIIYLCWISISFAQSPDVLAKAAFVSAQEYYSNGNYQSAVEQLKKAQSHLNGTNPRIDYLLTLCYAETEQIDNARTSLKNYFEQASDSDPNYMQMLGMVDKLDKLDVKNASKLKEEIDWKSTREENTSEAYHNYFLKYPSGKYINEALKGRTGLYGDNLTDSRDGKTYKTVYVGGYLWMAEDLQYDIEGYSSYSKKYNQYFYQAYVSRNELCPKGWRIPTIEDMFISLTIAGLNEPLIWTQGKAVTNKVYTADFAPLSNSQFIETLILSSDWGMSIGSNTTNLRIKPDTDKHHSTLLLKGHWSQFHIQKGEKLMASFTKLTGPEGVQYNFDNGNQYYGACRCIKE